MHFVFLDEFGHIGPFVSKDHARYNTSPVFGVAGYYLPEREVRPFASWFYRFKNEIYEKDIEASSRHRATWEKKGNEIFTAGHVYKTKRIGYTLINTIQNMAESYSSTGSKNTKILRIPIQQDFTIRY